MMRDQDEQDLCYKYFFYLVILFELRNVIRNGFPFVEFLEAQTKENVRLTINDMAQ